MKCCVGTRHTREWCVLQVFVVEWLNLLWGSVSFESSFRSSISVQTMVTFWRLSKWCYRPFLWLSERWSRLQSTHDGGVIFQHTPITWCIAQASWVASALTHHGLSTWPVSSLDLVHPILNMWYIITFFNYLVWFQNHIHLTRNFFYFFMSSVSGGARMISRFLSSNLHILEITLKWT